MVCDCGLVEFGFQIKFAFIISRPGYLVKGSFVWRPNRCMVSSTEFGGRSLVYP